ncbi:carbohydrate ABC transporter permease [Paenibacillus eucommiae]|uniref:Multiple sugar transport system permease protein n=1 Tax=Paenibacillus eucommiae TaxID=1355755 RepID=A0ABS4IND3_9BACL|nr:carbohydrate ABC transporter permease [Paenibacillus eucommiae]MBP1989072.1 multiple sugar transport system permease protein [Paenibacillus eucommiae]
MMRGKTAGPSAADRVQWSNRTGLALFDWMKNPRRINEKIARLAIYILLFDLAFVFIFPFLYMLVTSFKSSTDLYDFTVNWVPRTLRFANFTLAFKQLHYWDFFKNSAFVTAVATVGHLLSCSFVGYGFARYNFPFKKTLFMIVIIAFIVPIQTIIVPMYMVFANLKWLNSYLPILVPTFFGLGFKGALFIFIFRQFYLGIPRELENAAKIDGCGFLRTYWLIVFPIARSVFLVAIVLSIVWHWNDFYEPGIYASRPNLSMLPVKLSSMADIVKAPITTAAQIKKRLEHPEEVLNNAVLMAATLLVILPVLISFAFLQRKFMQGIERTGISGE